LLFNLIFPLGDSHEKGRHIFVIRALATITVGMFSIEFWCTYWAGPGPM